MANTIFGNRIRKLRLNSGMTMDELASKLNITKSRISMWENNGAVPREEMLTTKFIVLDKEYDEITESDLDALDFTEGEEILQIENGMVIGYVNSRGRRCIINITTSANSISLESVHDFYITHPIEQTLKYCVLITNTQHPNY